VTQTNLQARLQVPCRHVPPGVAFRAAGDEDYVGGRKALQLVFDHPHEILISDQGGSFDLGLGERGDAEDEITLGLVSARSDV
jgi:hypothetical protein